MPKFVDNLDGVPEDYHQFYSKVETGENKGKFQLDEIEPLRNSLGNAKRERDEARRKAALVAKWEGLGKSPEEIQELLDAAAEAERLKDEQSGNWDKIKGQMNDAHVAALGAKDTTIGKLKTRLEKELVEARATAVLAAAGGVPELLLPHVQRHTKVVEKDDDFIVQIVDKDGAPRVDAQGNSMTIEALVAEMKKSDTFARAFDGNPNSGSGAPPSGRPGGALPSGTNRSKMGPREKSAYIREHGSKAFLALPL